jgi:hypothetical protein
MMTEQEQQNYEKARELQRIVERWVDETFNFLKVSVVERIAENPVPNSGDYASCLFEHIRQESINDLVDDYLIDIDVKTKEALKQEAKEELFLEPENEILSDKEFRLFLIEEKEQEIREYYEDRENYPLWGTVFEFKERAPEHWLEKAQSVGLGVIESFDEFNHSLFMTSCGHSFYGSYWIPLYLSIFRQYNDNLAKYANVDFSMV